MKLPTLESLDVTNKTVLLRLDLNVPMQAGRVTDDTRIRRALPTLQHLIANHAKVVIFSHFGRPKGKVDLSLSLAPLVNVLSEALWDRPVGFSPDCTGSTAHLAVENAKPGDVILMENLRFHAGEETNDAEFTAELAQLGDVYVNDAFSCSHRAHASVVGLAEQLPAAAGELMAEEVAALHSALNNPARPLAAVVGGAKVSSKLELLGNLVEKVDKLIIGGAMANTFLLAQGLEVGASLVEHDLTDTAKRILAQATQTGCEIVLPCDAVVTRAFAKAAPSEIVSTSDIPSDAMMLDIGPQSLMAMCSALSACKSVVWNGPMGAFETSPFDASTVTLARHVAALSRAGSVHSVAGGGDTVAALAHAGLSDQFSYLSTAGGAFLEWLEGKELPGLKVLLTSKTLARMLKA